MEDDAVGWGGTVLGKETLAGVRYRTVLYPQVSLAQEMLPAETKAYDCGPTALATSSRLTCALLAHKTAFKDDVMVDAKAKYGHCFCREEKIK